MIINGSSELYMSNIEYELDGKYITFKNLEVNNKVYQIYPWLKLDQNHFDGYSTIGFSLNGRQVFTILNIWYDMDDVKNLLSGEMIRANIFKVFLSTIRIGAETTARKIEGSNYDCFVKPIDKTRIEFTVNLRTTL